MTNLTHFTNTNIIWRFYKPNCSLSIFNESTEDLFNIGTNLKEIPIKDI